jgi:hypothetical protein
MKGSSKSTSVVKWVLFRAAAVAMSCLFALLVAELALRTVPVPGVDFASHVYDPDLKMYKYAPNSRVISTNNKRGRIVRKVNSEGYLDENHSRRNPKKVYRIGFFGDSYVEAIQVPVEYTFFRLIQARLTPDKFEVLAFGDSGHGALHSYLKSRKYAKYFDLDMVVYVFVENDLGDQIERIKATDTLPYAEIVNGRLVVNDDRVSRHAAQRVSRDKLKRFVLWDSSVVMQTVYRRYRLLTQHGVNIAAEQSDFDMSTKGDIAKVPNQDDVPSTWSDAYKLQAIELGEAVISRWFQETKLSGRRFAVLYIPRASEWKKDDARQDSWKCWLKTYCQKQGIDFIDPTSEFLVRDRLGKTIFEDHLSKDGHRAFAEAFVHWLKKSRLE